MDRHLKIMAKIALGALKGEFDFDRAYKRWMREVPDWMDSNNDLLIMDNIQQGYIEMLQISADMERETRIGNPNLPGLQEGMHELGYLSFISELATLKTKHIDKGKGVKLDRKVQDVIRELFKEYNIVFGSYSVSVDKVPYLKDFEELLIDFRYEVGSAERWAYGELKILERIEGVA